MFESEFDLLAIGAHPDDVEMSAGGCIAQNVQLGKRVAIVDCTRGELGTRGSIEIRKEEAQRAAQILGVQHREILEMTDGSIDQREEYVVMIVTMLRRYRPHIVLIPPAFERHPDHEAVHRLCRTAYFKSGLTKLKTYDNGVEQQPFRPAHMFAFIQAYHQEVDFFVDVSSSHEIKMESIKAYSSQVHVASTKDAVSTSEEPQTFISRPEFMEMLEARARYFGSIIGVRYAEGFQSIDAVGFPNFNHWLPTRS